MVGHSVKVILFVQVLAELIINPSRYHSFHYPLKQHDCRYKYLVNMSLNHIT